MKWETSSGTSPRSTSMNGTSHLLMDNKWKGRYLKLAREIAGWSKDPSTKIGCVIIGSKGQVLAQGYNGFPRGIQDTPERYADRPTKYKYVVHAEMNAIYNASYSGVSLDGSVLFVHGLPVCSECAKGIIQVGIKNIVMPWQEIPATWQDSWNLTQQMFKEAGITWEFVKFE